MDKTMVHCSDACMECCKACMKAVKYCLQKGGKHVEASLLLKLVECAQLSQACANFCIHGSEQCGPVCDALARVADECVKMCDAFMEPEMKQCAQACRQCASCCRDVMESAAA